MRMRVVWSISLVTRASIQITTVMDTTNTISWLKSMPLSASATTNAPNTMPPPRMRQSVGRCSLVSRRTSRAPETEISGTMRPSRKTVW